MSISDIQKKITPIMKEYNVEDAYIFGSFARGENKDDSDIDLMVSFGEGKMGMFGYMKFINSLEDALERKVDVITKKSMSPYISPYIEKDLKIIYEK